MKSNNKTRKLNPSCTETQEASLKTTQSDNKFPEDNKRARFDSSLKVSEFSFSNSVVLSDYHICTLKWCSVVVKLLQLIPFFEFLFSQAAVR